MTDSLDTDTGMRDPAAFGPALAKLMLGLAANPVAALEVVAKAAAAAVDPDDGTQAKTDDRRFTDPAWEENGWFFAQRQAYLAWSRGLEELPGVSGLQGVDAAKAEFALERIAEALAPTNFLWGNPEALRKAVETGGASVLDGLSNCLDDMTENRGKPQQVDASQFEVGANLAATPGKVVFRNDLMELIQYAPQTGTVHAVPLLMSPPWINRYYIMDLAPGRSFVEWAVSHGHTTFAISYRNADSSMRDVGLEDYMGRGLGEAVDVVREITGAPHVNVAGLCVGGTLAVMLGAWLAGGKAEARPGVGAGKINSITLLNTLVDFDEPGQLAVFTDAEAVQRVEERMAEHGFLDGRELADTFDSLRANDLIWNYVGASWLRGEGPPAFDILAWNADATNVPEATHSQYLRALYLSNSLARGSMRVKGRTLAPKGVTADTYVLAARGDHITPWLGSYRTTGLLGGAVRFVLSSAGHIAGIVNPPGPKRKYWTNDDVPPEPDGWLAGATEHSGSWWDDWADWIAARAGDRRPAPPELGSTAHPALTDAPGTYVTG